MGNAVHHINCPVCKGTQLAEALRAEDFTVSHEKFAILHCNNCSFRFTQDAPNEQEIGRYYKSSEYISHTNSNKGIINRLYHLVRNYTLVQKRKLVRSVTGKQQGNLLDVGAGTGYFAAEMKKAGWSVMALEPDTEARRNALDENNVSAEPVEQLFQLAPGSFDCITLWHVLEHVHDLHGYIQQFYKLLKDDGSLIIAVPNYTSADGEAYGSNWAAYDVPRHLWHFSPSSMGLLMASHKFQVDDHKPMWFDSFYVSMLSEKYKGGGMVSAISNGLKSNIATKGDARLCSSVIYIISKV